MPAMARIPRSGSRDPCATYLLPFNDEYYYLPEANVLCYPMYTNVAPSQTIRTVLHSEDPSVWRDHLMYGRVMQIRGIEGSAVYTTFADQDAASSRQETQKRVLHQMPHSIAESCFPLLKEWALCAAPVPLGQPQNARVGVYDWRKGTNMPNHDRIDPVANGWPLADLSILSAAQIESLAPALPDPIADWDARMADIEAARQSLLAPQGHVPPPNFTAPPPAAEHAALLEGIDWNDDGDGEPLTSRQQQLGLAEPQVVVRQPHRLAQDLRTLADFLFECKDLDGVPEGAYLAASDALKRVWEQSAR